jgi:spore maturation protein CgeB
MTDPMAHSDHYAEPRRRLLLAGYWQVDYYERALADGFEACGVEVVPFMVGRFLRKDLWSRLERKMLRGPVISRLNRELIRTVAECRPEIVFLFLPIYIYASTVAHIREDCGAVVVSHNHDNPYEDGRRWLLWRNYHACIRHCDLNYTSRPASVEHAAREGVPNPRLLKQFYIAGVHRPIFEVEPEFRNDVVFAGHYEPDGRDAILEYLIESGIDLRIFGPAWNLSSRPNVRAQSPYIVEGDRYVQALAGAKIALVFLSARNKDFYTTRCFEIPACGTMMLAPRNDMLKAMFEEGREAVYYSSKEELLSKIRYYLANEGERQRIARAGHERCMRDGHSNIDRACHVLRDANEIVTGRGRANLFTSDKACVC